MSVWLGVGQLVGNGLAVVPILDVGCGFAGGGLGVGSQRGVRRLPSAS